MVIDNIPFFPSHYCTSGYGKWAIICPNCNEYIEFTLRDPDGFGPFEHEFVTCHKCKLKIYRWDMPHYKVETYKKCLACGKDYTECDCHSDCILTKRYKSR